MRARRAIAPLLLSGLLVACGDDGGPSAEDFLDELNEICADVDREADDVEEPPADATLGERADALDELVEVFEEAEGRLDDLEPPDDLESDYEDFTDAYDEGLAAVRALAEASADEELEAAIDAEVDLGQATDRLRRAAEELDADDCATFAETDASEEPTDDTATDDTATGGTETADTTGATTGDDGDDFRSKLVAICTTALAQLDAVGQPGVLDDFAGWENTANELELILVDTVAKTTVLPVPSELFGPFNDLNNAIFTQLELVRQLRAAAQSGDAAGIEALFPEFEANSAALDTASDALGVPECRND